MRSHITYNVALIHEDMAVKGLQPIDLAARMGVSPSTLSRFFSGQHRTAKTAKRIAVALGFSSPRRYVVQVNDVPVQEVPRV